MKMEVEQHGLEKAVADLDKLGDRAKDIRPLGRQLGRIVADSNERRYSTRGNGRWAPLAASTQARKARAGQDSRILRATGALHNSLVHPQMNAESGTELRFGTDVPYARFADRGTRNEPQRKLMELRPSEVRETEKLVNDYVAEGRK
jgi:phage gpG-like protein